MYTLIGTTWKKRIPFTQEEKEQIMNGEHIEIKWEEAPEERASELDAIWENVKPEEEFQLIAVDINDNDRGIINYRVNGEHLQKRF